ncbi:hypothetical protein GMRT_15874 [Giardia muris]|uniref:Uncharacterized protein n=1 Tax=Giardia muris TaxID=5742 RepID=A0A4Z1SVN9_GIAMU|nr:hypothetical protein GMRT_15874 [Giardia muris]|eukprot:TNJ29922.1 hypothetical protein GMRT_15874 [Giardia muris]
MQEFTRSFNTQGTREAPCFDRRMRSLQRKTGLPNVGDYDYRYPSVIEKDFYPTTLSESPLGLGSMNLSIVDEPHVRTEAYNRTLKASLDATRRHNQTARSHYGPSYYRRGYYNRELAELMRDEAGTLGYIGAEGYTLPAPSLALNTTKKAEVIPGYDNFDPLPSLPGMPKPAPLAPGTYSTMTHQFREQRRIERYHTGTYQHNPIDGCMQWSCCGRFAKDDPGCTRRVSYPNRTNYELTPQILTQ